MPDTIQFTAGHQNYYTYDASGKKLEVQNITSRNILNLPQDTITRLVSSTKLTTDYCEDAIYQNDTLKEVLTPEGYWQNGLYYYYLKDHQGSTREVLRQDNTVMEYSDYYPDGMRFWTSTSNSAALPYRYNGKELEAMNGLNEYDYGARRREPGIPVWTTLDPLAEKYYSISPYVYCKGNPVRFVDLHGDSLTVSANTGNTTALNTFETIENSSMGGFYTLGKSGTGKYTLNSTGKTGTMTAEEQASYDMLNTIISNPKDAKFVVVDGNDAISSSIMVGDNGTATGITATPGVHTIDVGDANQFGTTGLLTAQGAIGHELSEGFDIQVNGAKPNSAHFNTGIPTENKINGTISGGATINPNGSITVSVTYNGKTKIVTIIFTNGNIGVGGVTNNIKYMIIGFYT